MRTFASKHVATGLPYSRWTAAFCVVAPHRAPEAVSFRALRALSAVARYPARDSDSQRARAPSGDKTSLCVHFFARAAPHTLVPGGSLDCVSTTSLLSASTKCGRRVCGSAHARRGSLLRVASLARMPAAHAHVSGSAPGRPRTCVARVSRLCGRVPVPNYDSSHKLMTKRHRLRREMVRASPRVVRVTRASRA